MLYEVITNRGGHLLQRQIQPQQCFRMPQEDIASNVQVPYQFGQQTFLGRTIKVDNHVAAENYIERFPESEVVIHEVKAAETRQGASYNFV